jgi:sodium-dependent phosphate cotransporter
LTVGVLFPIELITGYLYYLTKAMLPKDVDDGDKWEGPVKKIVSPFGKLIIEANKKITTAVAEGTKDCADFYPVFCNLTEEHPDPTYDTCLKGEGSTVGLITCDKKTGKCPAFFQNGASRRDDEISGGVCFFLALVILIICLIGLVTILQKMLMGASTRIIYKATNINGYLAILIGAGITVVVQSSSITTSALTPFVGVGALRLEQMLPLTLGANIGTTVTGLMASLVSDSKDSLHVALCHLFFNITGILIWYPVPFMRNIPLNLARLLGKGTRVWRGFPIVYILTIFLLIPLILFGISSLFEQDSRGYVVLGSIVVIILGLLLIYFIYKWVKGGLKERTIAGFERRQRAKQTYAALPDDMEMIKAELARLREHTGLPQPEPASDETDEEAA